MELSLVGWAARSCTSWPRNICLARPAFEQQAIVILAKEGDMFPISLWCCSFSFGRFRMLGAIAYSAFLTMRIEDRAALRACSWRAYRCTL
mmetsp:Transcript_106391/g.167984  ORF Transcript_106391/g.167984 Transcript_106391/m.167984 type:complete len:91 (-) Transcript_106391:327-599(-)